MTPATQNERAGGYNEWSREKALLGSGLVGDTNDRSRLANQRMQPTAARRCAIMPGIRPPRLMRGR